MDSEDADPPMVRCEVTGRLVAPGDAVEFRGQTVCAEGKEILLRRLMNGGLVQGLTRPGVVRRLLCYLLDALVLTLVGLPTTIRGWNSFRNADSVFEPRLFAWQFFGLACAFLYPALMHGAWGKTLGKMAGGCRVVNMDGSRIGYGRAAIRAFWSNAVLGIPGLLYGVLPGAAMSLNIVFGFYSLANCIALLADRDMNRALHDRLAGTRVIMDPAETDPTGTEPTGTESTETDPTGMESTETDPKH